jgi:hypothetical protein
VLKMRSEIQHAMELRRLLRDLFFTNFSFINFECLFISGIAHDLINIRSA